MRGRQPWPWVRVRAYTRFDGVQSPVFFGWELGSRRGKQPGRKGYRKNSSLPLLFYLLGSVICVLVPPLRHFAASFDKVVLFFEVYCLVYYL
jgi:hypothetical protein